jgi:hypothetical protein
MPAFLTARVIAWIVAVLGAAGAITAFAVHERSVEAAKIDAKIASITAKAEAKRTKDLAAQAAADQIKLNSIENGYAQALKASNDNAASLVSRLHDYEVASRRRVAVPGTPATSAGPDAPATKPASDSGVDRAVGQVIVSAARDADQVIALQRYIKQECLK